MAMHEQIHSRGWRVRRGAGIALVVLAAVTALGFVVMGLWNNLMPAIFGLRTLGFWQALGLLILARILFGGFHRGPGHGFRRRRRMMERWEKMTPEEREKFREGLRGRCGC
jgi:hypothetical protein